MTQIELSYEDLKQEMIKEIRKYEFGFLATSEGVHVTVREIRCIPSGLTIYCFTDQRSRKWKQIMANPNVAIAFCNHRVPKRGLQIEGVASLKGQPLDKENINFIKAYKETQPEAYERSSKRHFIGLPNLRVIEIVPRIVAFSVQGSTASETYIEILDVAKGEAYRVMPNIKT
jgi:general stress protein 26